MDGVTMATQPTESAKQQQKVRGGTGDELAIIAQRAQAFTNASGVAIALAEGDNTEEIICRARSGSSAPDVGTALRVEGTFTGLCIQTGKELRCDDAETDTRVDMTAIRALDIRSMVVTPIREDSKVIGVLAVFAPTAHAFTITHVAVLKTMSDQISAAIQRERRVREEGGAEEAVRQYAPVAMPKPAASAAAPSPVLIKPAAASRAASPAKVESIKPVPLADELAAPVPFPKKKEERPEVRASFGTFDAVAGEHKSSGSSRMIIVAAAVLVVTAGSVFTVLKMRTKPAAQPVAAQQTQETANPAAAPGQPANAASAAPGTSNQVATLTVGAAVPSNGTKFSADTSAADAARKADRNTSRSGDTTSEKTVAVDRTERVVTAPVAVNSSPSRIAATSTAAQPGAEVAPSLTVGTGSTNANALSALAQPVGESRPKAVMAQSDLEPLATLKSVPPVYPAIAKARRITGTVVVEVKVGKDGRVSNPRLVSGPPIFRDAAFDAVKQWIFRPAKLNGQPIEQITQIRVDFRPN